MSREDIRKLLGGYATDTLSEAERRALCEAALEDQELFDALAKEEALREVVRDPSARRQLVDALGPAREPYATRAWRWLGRPQVLAMAGGAAVLLIVGGLVLRQTRHTAHQEVMVADAIAPAPPTALPPTARPLKKLKSAAVEREPRRLSAGGGVGGNLKLPVDRALGAPTATQSAAPQSPPPPAASAPQPSGAAAGCGGVTPAAPADTAEEKVQVLQMAPTVKSFAPQPVTGRNAAPLPLPALAKAVSAVAVEPALKYSLLLQDAGGAYSPVPAGTAFHAGDSVRLRVASREDGYIYLLQRAATTGWKLVESRPVEKSQAYELPSTGGLESDTPATVQLLLVFSRAEQLDLAHPATADMDALASTATNLSPPAAGASGRLAGARPTAGQRQAAFSIMIEYR